MAANVIDLDERRRTRIPASQDVLDEARMELAVSRAERFSYAATEHDAWRAVLFAEAKGDLDRIGRIAAERLRRSVQERGRAEADMDGPEPDTMRAAA